MSPAASSPERRPVIERSRLRDQILRELRDRLVNGGIVPGERIAEASLAAELGVSRTPLREALHVLEHEGLLTSKINYGFEALPLSEDEIQEIYPIFGALQRLAVTLGDLPEPPVIARLRGMVEEGLNLSDPERYYVLDNEFHVSLVAHCPNRRLTELLDSYRRLLRRYDYFYVQHRPLPKESAEQHQRIVAFLESGDAPAAAAALEEHWQWSLEVLVERLRDAERRLPRPDDR